jgi:hypothetical protein
MSRTNSSRFKAASILERPATPLSLRALSNSNWKLGAKAMPRYADLGVAIYEYSGLLREARQILETTLARDDELHQRLHWLSLSERIGDTDAIIAWLKTVPSTVAGQPQDLMTLALAIDRLIDDAKCYPIGYRALRGAYADPQMHLGYMIGLVLTGRSRNHAFRQPEEVGPDTAVLLTEKSGGRHLVRILETLPDPTIERGEIAPDRELGVKLLGRKVGNEIEVDSLGVEPTVYVIHEIRDKFLHAHFRSLEEFEQLFPGHQAFGSFQIDESRGEERFKPIFDSVKRRGEFALQLKELYRKGQTPLMLMSRFSGVSPCEAWDFVVSEGGLPLCTCIGLPQEFAQAIDLLAAKPKAVIDPITLYGLSRLGIAEQMRACFEDLGVVQTTIDLLRRLVAERSQEKGTHHGTLGWDGEHYRMIEIDDAVSSRRIEQAEKALAFAESLTLVPAETSGDLQPGSLELFEDLDPSFLDTLYAAQGGERLLFSDELVFRQLAREIAGVEGVWTQPAALRAGQRGVMSADVYCEVIAALIGADYRFTQINHDIVLHCLKKDTWDNTYTVQRLADQIAAPSNETGSIQRLLSDVIQFGWAQRPSDKVYHRFFRALFRAFRKAQPSCNLEALARAPLSIVYARLRLTSEQMFVTTLYRTTSHTPAQRIVDEIDMRAQHLFEKIDNIVIEAANMASTSAATERNQVDAAP